MILQHTLGAGRIFLQHRANTRRPRRKVAAAIRTNAAEMIGGASLAKCAFERADLRPRRVSGQIAIAPLAIGTHVQHQPAQDALKIPSIEAAIVALNSSSD